MIFPITTCGLGRLCRFGRWQARKTALLLAGFILVTGLNLLGLAWVFFPLLQSPPDATYLPIITRPLPSTYLLGLINTERVSRGLTSLTADSTLAQVAGAHSLDMATRDYLEHVNPEGDHAGDRLDRAGYQWLSWGEVIAGGYDKPQETLQGWLNSPAHRVVLLNPVFVEIGAGYSKRAGTKHYHYWCVVLALPKGSN